MIMYFQKIPVFSLPCALFVFVHWGPVLRYIYLIREKEYTLITICIMLSYYKIYLQNKLFKVTFVHVHIITGSYRERKKRACQRKIWSHAIKGFYNVRKCIHNNSGNNQMSPSFRIVWMVSADIISFKSTM